MNISNILSIIAIIISVLDFIYNFIICFNPKAITYKKNLARKTELEVAELERKEKERMTKKALEGTLKIYPNTNPDKLK